MSRRDGAGGVVRPPLRRAAPAMGLAALLAAGAGLLLAGVWMPAKAELAQWLLNRAWNASRAAQASVRPWPWADTWPVARLRLPQARRPLIVLAGASGRNLAFGPAHMDGSPLPGARGVAVIAGHRDTYFRSLGRLAIGDRLEIERTDGSRYRYEITAIDVVDARDEELRLDVDEPMLALVTCYPFDALTPGGPLRYVVLARRVGALSFGAAHAAADARF